MRYGARRSNYCKLRGAAFALVGRSVKEGLQSILNSVPAIGLNLSSTRTQFTAAPQK
jgi:hypothetical protein